MSEPTDETGQESGQTTPAPETETPVAAPTEAVTEPVTPAGSETAPEATPSANAPVQPTEVAHDDLDGDDDEGPGAAALLAKAVSDIDELRADLREIVVAFTKLFAHLMGQEPKI